MYPTIATRLAIYKKFTMEDKLEGASLSKWSVNPMPNRHLIYLRRPKAAATPQASSSTSTAIYADDNYALHCADVTSLCTPVGRLL